MFLPAFCLILHRGWSLKLHFYLCFPRQRNIKKCDFTDYSPSAIFYEKTSWLMRGRHRIQGTPVSSTSIVWGIFDLSGIRISPNTSLKMRSSAISGKGVIECQRPLAHCQFMLIIELIPTRKFYTSKFY